MWREKKNGNYNTEYWFDWGKKTNENLYRLPQKLLFQTFFFFHFLSKNGMCSIDGNCEEGTLKSVQDLSHGDGCVQPHREEMRLNDLVQTRKQRDKGEKEGQSRYDSIRRRKEKKIESLCFSQSPGAGSEWYTVKILKWLKCPWHWPQIPPPW